MINKEILTKRKLEDKVSIITGAGSGIGRSTALLFAKEGAKVVVWDIDCEGGEKTIDLIKQEGGDGLFIQTDVTESEQIQNAVKSTIKKYKNINILVNNTGIFREGDVVEISEVDWQSVLNVNLNGAFLCMKYCIPEMIKCGGGSIVNVASEAGIVGIENQVAYNVSKSGVISLTKSTALDFALKNIKINCVCPGRCHTSLVQNIIDSSDDPEEKLRVLSEDRPLKRMGKPEEIAQSILFLASDKIPYMIGAVLSVDGGYTIQ